MKEGGEKQTGKDPQEVKSSDIPNAHASGDGTMGRNDEKVQEDDGAADEKCSDKKNESNSY